ncbi:MAG: acyl carrier protein [Butyrivibrio sp.]|uniref:acyl carrier protein n=1 Tax=Butyrivibrio sp. TaxID=28121 RepID=UPI001B2E2E47|nr:acyl carrier protein [Butyrivibrio sp.]MBO6241541.1 acyl carrier protein [Butyrivibrio sp.]
MTLDDLINEIKTIVDNNMEVNKDTVFSTGLEFDSMQMIYLISRLEDEYKVVIDLEKLSNINTVADLYNSITMVKEMGEVF